MKYKNRALALLLAGCMVFGAGCGAASKDSGQQAAEEVQAGEKAAEDIKSSENASGSAKQPGRKSAPQVDIFSGQDMDWYSEDQENWLVHGEYAEVTVGGEGYEAVAESIHKWSEEKVSQFWTSGESILELAEDDPSSYGRGRDSYLYSFTQDVEAARVDSQVISLVELYDQYTGGAHSIYGYTGYTFDAESGQMLELSDVLKDEEGFRQKAEEYMIKKLKETYGDALIPTYDTAVKEMWDRNGGLVWYLDGAGITFVFNPYGIGSFAMGEARVTLPYAEFDVYLSDKYTSMSETGTAQIPFGETVSLAGVPGGNGQEGKLLIYDEIDDEYGYGPVYVELNGSGREVGEFARVHKACLLKREGRTFVILDADYASADYVTFVYEITDGNVVERNRLENVSLYGASVNTERMNLSVDLNVLGTYHTMMGYTMDESGKLHQESEFFDIPSEGSDMYLLVTKKELPVRIEDGVVKLPVGSRIRITGTNNKGIALFWDEDTGAEGDIRYTRGDGGEDTWTIYIDGVQEYDYFEMIPYTG